jgi:hypothetical protein
LEVMAPPGAITSFDSSPASSSLVQPCWLADLQQSPSQAISDILQVRRASFMSEMPLMQVSVS